MSTPHCSFVTVALVLGVSGVVGPTATLHAQLSAGLRPDATAALSARDSLRILGQAHDAQFHFEVYRREELPRTAPSDIPACETTIGRMCYWSEPDGTKPIPEPGAITRARLRLIATLSRLAERSRADAWIAGERVRYMVENGDDSAAVVAARECWTSKWWCGALLGFALHASGQYAESEAAFDSALAAMPHDVRCRWSDISLLLDDDERDAYRKLPCDARGDTERRFWALAQPSYMVRGNDRRTEHFSRVLLAELSQNAENAYGMPWGDDLRELLIRYGEATWYATTWPDALGSRPGTMGHDREPAYHFAAIHGHGDSVHWDVRAKLARERYSPPYIDSIADLDAQFAMLKRGDSALVVVVYADSNRSAHTVLGVSADAPVARVASDTTVAIRVRRARTAWRGVVAGVEWYDPATRRDSRARTWIAPPVAPPGAPALSTLVLFAGDSTTTVGTLDEALAHALTANELRAGHRMLGLYWEVYGTTPDDTLGAADGSDLSITVSRLDGGIFSRLGQALRIVPRASPLAIGWHDAQIGEGVAARSVVLDLAQLPPGKYRITLAAGPDATHRTMTSREIRLR